LLPRRALTGTAPGARTGPWDRAIDSTPNHNKKSNKIRNNLE
jgi:hypothetical protein